MGLPSVLQTGISGMAVARAGVATTGHNIANSNTEGYSRQRIQISPDTARPSGGSAGYVGTGALLQRVERVNSEYVEKQMRNANKDLAHMEEKDIVLRQTEDIFNEMNGDGLNRLISRFFNEFRKLSNEPENEALRQSVRESTNALVGDFHRLRNEVEDVRRHIDARLENYSGEVNALAVELKDLNQKIRLVEAGSGSPNDMLDRRDSLLKQIATYMDVNTHKDNNGNVTVDIVGIGPLVVNSECEQFSVFRSPADAEGKPENAYDIRTTASAAGVVTHQLRGGKFGALLEVRDQTLSTVLDRLDELALTLSSSVNDIHMQGFTKDGRQGVAFFKPMDQKHRASEFIELSDEIRGNTNNIATAATPHSPGDNRIAIAISGLQTQRVLNDGQVSFDDWYNSVVSDIGVVTSRNRSSINQQRDILNQLGRTREQLSGVSIDEETSHLMQFQQAYGASAKVIQVADEMLKTVLELKR